MIVEPASREEFERTMRIDHVRWIQRSCVVWTSGLLTSATVVVAGDRWGIAALGLTAVGLMAFIYDQAARIRRALGDPRPYRPRRDRLGKEKGISMTLGEAFQLKEGDELATTHGTRVRFVRMEGADNDAPPRADRAVNLAVVRLPDGTVTAMAPRSLHRPL